MADDDAHPSDATEYYFDSEEIAQNDYEEHHADVFNLLHDCADFFQERSQTLTINGKTIRHGDIERRMERLQDKINDLLYGKFMLPSIERGWAVRRITAFLITKDDVKSVVTCSHVCSTWEEHFESDTLSSSLWCRLLLRSVRLLDPNRMPPALAWVKRNMVDFGVPQLFQRCEDGNIAVMRAWKRAREWETKEDHLEQWEEYLKTRGTLQRLFVTAFDVSVYLGLPVNKNFMIRALSDSPLSCVSRNTTPQVGICHRILNGQQDADKAKMPWAFLHIAQEGDNFPHDATIHGRDLTRAALYGEVIRLCRNADDENLSTEAMGEAWYCLGNIIISSRDLAADDSLSVAINGGNALTWKECYVNAIECGNSRGWRALVSGTMVRGAMVVGETVIIRNRTYVNRGGDLVLHE